MKTGDRLIVHGQHFRVAQVGRVEVAIWSGRGSEPVRVFAKGPHLFEIDAFLRSCGVDVDDNGFVRGASLEAP